MDLTKDTISHNYELPILRDDISTHIKVCKNCQKTRKALKYGQIPSMDVESIPQERLLVDLIVTYNLVREG